MGTLKKYTYFKLTRAKGVDYTRYVGDPELAEAKLLKDMMDKTGVIHCIYFSNGNIYPRKVRDILYYTVLTEEEVENLECHYNIDL